MNTFLSLAAAATQQADSAQYIAIITSIGSVIAAIVAVVGAIAARRTHTPADDNDAARVAREWYRGMLEDAKGEREELRKSIDELRTTGLSKTATIDRLENLIRIKDQRISELEERQRNNVEKLQSGAVLTLSDVLGLDAASLPPLSVEMENTQFPYKGA